MNKYIFNIFFILVVALGIFIGISSKLFGHITEVKEKELAKKELKEKLIKINTNDNKNINESTANNTIDIIVEKSIDNIEENTKSSNIIPNKKFNKKPNKKKIIQKNKNYKNNKDNKKYILSGDVCFVGIINYDFINFISNYTYKNEYLIRNLLYKKKYKDYTKELKIKYICFKNLKISKNIYNAYKERINKLKTTEEKEKIFKIMLIKHSTSIFKGSILKDIGLGKITNLKGCLFKNYNKLLLKVGILFNKNEYNNLLLNNECYYNQEFKIYKMEKNVNTEKIYKLLFKSIKLFNKNKDKTYFKQFKYYTQGVENYFDYLLFNKKFNIIDKNSFPDLFILFINNYISVNTEK